MIVLDYSDRRPIYEQIVERFEELILRGVLEVDAPMPSVRSLAVDLSINPNTIQRAYERLEKEGWIYSVRGRGSFVASGKQPRTKRRKELREKLSLLMNEAALLGVTKEEFLRAVEETPWLTEKVPERFRAENADATTANSGMATDSDGVAESTRHREGSLTPKKEAMA